MPNIELVLCDVGNVIVLADIAITFRILEEAGVMSERAQTFFANVDYADFCRGKFSGLEFYSRLIGLHLDYVLRFPEVVQAHDDHMYGVDQGVLSVLECVKKPLAFATDTNVWQTARVKQLVDLRRFSDFIIRSDDPEIQLLKADDGAWQRILERLGIEPHKILFIDDSPNKIACAQAAGLIHTILFENAGQLYIDLHPFKVLH